jgi:putative hydrolase of the HAD superfamily
MDSSKPPSILGRVSDWVFDLDNTLYPRRCDLFAQIDRRMTEYVARLTGMPSAQARVLQKRLYRDHGTTLAGLMAEYRIDPHAYLAAVHDIDYSAVPPDPGLGRAIAALPGRKHIFTNADVAHAERTLEALGFGPLFDATFDIVAADFAPKPDPLAYRRFLSAHRVDPNAAAMFEDMPRNLIAAKALGMTTVLVVAPAGAAHLAEAWEIEGRDAGHIDHVTDDLTGFLAGQMHGEFGRGPKHAMDT